MQEARNLTQAERLVRYNYINIILYSIYRNKQSCVYILMLYKLKYYFFYILVFFTTERIKMYYFI